MDDVLSELERVMYEYICSVAGNIADGSGGEVQSNVAGVAVTGPLGPTSVFRFGEEKTLTVKRFMSATSFEPPQIVVKCDSSEDDIVTGNSTADVVVSIHYPIHDSADSTNLTQYYAEACGGLRTVLNRRDIAQQLNRFANEAIHVEGLVSRSQSRGVDEGRAFFAITLKFYAANIGMADPETAN